MIGFKEHGFGFFVVNVMDLDSLLMTTKLRSAVFFERTITITIKD